MNTRVYVFIDASNVWNVQKKKGVLFDYKKLMDYLEYIHKDKNMRVFYYTAYPKQDTRSYNTNRKHDFYTYLRKRLSFTVRKKPLKQIKTLSEKGQVIKEKGDMDVELTIDVLHYIEDFDVAVLFTGDSDYAALVKYLQKRNKEVHVYSSKNNISYELKTVANKYIEILTIPFDIWLSDRNLKAKNQKNPK